MAEKVTYYRLEPGAYVHGAGGAPLPRGFADATCFRLATNSSRSSVTLRMPNGDDIGWFRKNEVENGEEIGNWEDYVAVRQGHNRVLLVHHTSTVLSHIDIQATATTGNTINNQTTNTTKETTMKLIDTLLAANKQAAADSAFLEAGRIANNTVLKALLERVPFLQRFAARRQLNNPLAKLAIANGALALAQQFRPHDPRVKKLTLAMATQAYQETYQQFDIEGMIDSLLSNPSIKRALDKVDTPAQ